MLSYKLSTKVFISLTLLAAAANFLHLTFKVLSFVVQVNVKPFMRHKALPVLFYLLPVNLFQEWLLNCLFKPVEKTKKLFYRFLKQVVNLSCYLYVHKMKIIDTIGWSFSFFAFISYSFSISKCNSHFLN